MIIDYKQNCDILLYPLISGMIGCLWFIPWIIVARSNPKDHPWISVEEKEYLQEAFKLVDKVK